MRLRNVYAVCTRQVRCPVLCQLQRLASCYLPTGGLFDVTSAKLEQSGLDGDESGKAPLHKYVPLVERKCGLHAAALLYPKPQFVAELARTTNAAQAAQLNLQGTSVVGEVKFHVWQQT